jgi:hypothetical protein
MRFTCQILLKVCSHIMQFILVIDALFTLIETETHTIADKQKQNTRTLLSPVLSSHLSFAHSLSLSLVLFLPHSLPLCLAHIHIHTRIAPLKICMYSKIHTNMLGWHEEMLGWREGDRKRERERERERDRETLKLLLYPHKSSNIDI